MSFTYFVQSFAKKLTAKTYIEDEKSEKAVYLVGFEPKTY